MIRLPAQSPQNPPRDLPRTLILILPGHPLPMISTVLFFVLHHRLNPKRGHLSRGTWPRHCQEFICHLRSDHRPISVPPGFGKPQTHKRNERRRKKRQAERGSDDVPPVPAGGSNAIALGVANKSVLTPKPMMMMSLKNKNKRREFKNTIGMPSRITFQDNEVAPSPLPTLVPPSERDQLPPRLFVTSVDVEEDILPRNNDQNWDRKKKKKQRESYGQVADGVDVALDYSRTPEEDNTASASTQNYAALENAWENAPPLGEKDALSIGCVVGWQVRQSLTSFDE
jgi:hypothetical protein